MDVLISSFCEDRFVHFDFKYIRKGFPINTDGLLAKSGSEVQDGNSNMMRLKNMVEGVKEQKNCCGMFISEEWEKGDSLKQ